MDIKDILDQLGLDLTNPETKRGAIDAISAILASRKPMSSPSPNSSNSNEQEIELEIDPDLVQPSQKHNPDPNSPTPDIEDEENLLDKVKHNESEDNYDGINEPGEPDESAETAKTNQDNDPDKAGEPTESEEANKSVELDTEESDTQNDQDAFGDHIEQDKSNEQTEDDTLNEPSKQDKYEPDELGDDNGDETNKNSTNEDENSTEDEDEDEDELVSDKLKNIYDDQSLKAKQEARKIKRERTLQAAHAALTNAKAKKANSSLIRELEKAIEALEALTEAVNKNISDISDDEFNMLVNRVFDAIDALGDSKLTYKTDKERELQVKEIKTDLASDKTQQELSAEDVAQIRAETQAIKAREKESAKYKARSSSSFKGFQEFLNSLYKAVALQVQIDRVHDKSWSALNRRYSGTSILQPGQKIQELPNKKIPVIDFYFDCSGSWTDSDLKVGQKAINQLVEMEENGQIKINIFYFANNVHTDKYSARVEGQTRAWNEIVKNVIATQATNVIIMTDSDMENWWNGPKALSYTVPGYVWYLWRNGENAPRLPRDLKGRGGTQQFSFSTNDA